MFKNIITRAPGKSIRDGITSSGESGNPIYDKAISQHRYYIKALESCGVSVFALDALEEFPDSCFVEDCAVLTPKCAIITNPGAPSRHNETPHIISAVNRFYPDDQIAHINTPGTVEGGDVMMVGDHFYIGLSARTNKEGYRQFSEIIKRFGYAASIIPVSGFLHLKTGLSYLENDNLLVAGEFIREDAFKRFNRIIVNEHELYSANCVWVNGKVLVPVGYPKTEESIRDLGYEVLIVDSSEYRKINGGLSCLSLRF